MSLATMRRTLLGDIPGMPLPKATSVIQECLGVVYDRQRWSFQIQMSGWLTPGLLGGVGGSFVTPASPGTISVTAYTNTVVGDAVATAAWNALTGRPFLTEYQLRIYNGALYSVVGYDPGTNQASPNPGFGTITLDRPWMEPTQTVGGYMMYQAYFPAPDPTFRAFRTMLDVQNNSPMDFRTYTQDRLMKEDPQRMAFNNPVYAVPYKVDDRPNTATPGCMLYELWPHPLIRLNYSHSSLRRGPQLVNPTDMVPSPLTEDLVLWLSREQGYIWKESQKGDGVDRGSGANWMNLAKVAREEFELRLKEVKLLDVERGDLYWNKFDRDFGDSEAATVVTGGTMNVGTWN